MLFSNEWHYLTNVPAIICNCATVCYFNNSMKQVSNRWRLNNKERLLPTSDFCEGSLAEEGSRRGTVVLTFLWKTHLHLTHDYKYMLNKVIIYFFKFIYLLTLCMSFCNMQVMQMCLYEFSTFKYFASTCTWNSWNRDLDCNIWTVQYSKPNLKSYRIEILIESV